ncbi:MAG: 50S ribosomal protein L4 [Desulfobulbus propionicus]|nr:MAG: 50S ribosomal protein L4 [Desulfobulbus propionicus]
MAVCDVVNNQAEKVGEIELNEDLFAVEVNTGILHEVVCMQRANRRTGNASTKNRSEVRGGGAKPWRQKGTGRARSGTKSSPVWRGGGTVFGPKPRDYSYSMPKKVKRLALKMALSTRLKENNLVVVNDLGLKEIKTKDFVAVMHNFQFDDCLVITMDNDETAAKSCRNAIGYKVLPVAGLNVYDILKYSKLMLVQNSIEKIEERLLV